MNGDRRTDRPAVAHRLALALRFLDAFTDEPVGVPLAVSIPERRWPARRSEPDGTYRFLATNATVPAGLFTIEVLAPGGEYVSWEAILEALPRPAPPAPPVRATDYLVERPLWPTRRFRPPPGETAIVGRVTSAGGGGVAGLRVAIARAGPPIPAAPFTRTDASGDFLFRLPRLKASVAGGVVVSAADLAIEVRDPAGAGLAVHPPNPFSVALGQVTVLRFEVP